MCSDPGSPPEVLNVNPFLVSAGNTIDKLRRCCQQDERSNQNDGFIAPGFAKERRHGFLLFFGLTIKLDISRAKQNPYRSISDHDVGDRAETYGYSFQHARYFCSVLVRVGNCLIKSPDNITGCAEKNNPDENFARDVVVDDSKHTALVGASMSHLEE
jgi:hypothetical protein